MSVSKPQIDPTTSQMGKIRISSEDQQLNKLTTADIPNEQNGETRPQIFKLIDDCLHQMFDWLSIGDIHSISETCTHMQRIAGDYFHPHLASLELEYRSGEFNTRSNSIRNLNGFKEFVQKLRIDELVNDDGYRCIGLHCKSLKQISFSWNRRLNKVQIEHMKPILCKIETLEFSRANVRGEFYKEFLQLSPQLKYLSIDTVNLKAIIGANNKWLSQSYPTLEHFQLISSGLEIPELATFFKRNSENLQKLSLNDNTFERNINAMLNAKMKLQVLSLSTCEVDEIIFAHLKQLRDQEFYQRLHIDMWILDQQKIDRISTIHGLEKLDLPLFRRNSQTAGINLNSLTDLKVLSLDGQNHQDLDTFVIDLELTAKSLVNLELVYYRNIESKPQLFRNIKCKMIVPFIQYSTKLKAIKIDYFKDENFIDLSSLNKMREKLIGARKIIIYLHEKMYLETKWGNKRTDFAMIQIKRAESNEWQRLFSL